MFDGASFVINGDGSLAVQLRDWEEQEVATRWTRTAKGWRCDRGEVATLAEHPEDIYCAMVLALRDYVDRNRFPGVVLGLSGGIDSRDLRRDCRRCAGAGAGLVRDAAEPLSPAS